jgi:hypothetical protein
VIPPTASRPISPLLQDRGWECFNFPAIVLLVVLAGLFLACVLLLVGMLGVRLWRERNGSEDDTLSQ